MRRKLDGVFFRIGRENICFSDLTEEQQDEVMKERSQEWLKSLCKILANCLKAIGDQFDIVRGPADEGDE